MADIPLELTQPTPRPAGNDADKVAEAVRRLLPLFEALAVALRRTTEAVNAFKLPTPPSGGQNATQSLPGAAPSTPPSGGGGGGIMGALGSLAGTAATAAGALAAIPAVVTPFVNAFNPALVELFGIALKNLAATLGYAFEPVLRVFLGIARQLNDVIGPAAAALRPIFEQMAGELAVRLMPVFKALAEIVVAMVPLFALMVEVSRPMAELLPVLANMIRLLVAVISGAIASFGGNLNGLKSANDSLIKGIREATRAVIVFAAQIARAFGMEAIVKSIQNTFKPVQAGQGKTAVPSEVGIAGMDQILKDAQIAAATAQGQGGPASVEDWLGDISGALKQALANQADWEGKIVEAIKRAAAALGMSDLFDNVKSINDLIRKAQSIMPSGTQAKQAGDVAAATFFGPFGILSNLFGR